MRRNHASNPFYSSLSELFLVALFCGVARGVSEMRSFFVLQDTLTPKSLKTSQNLP